MYEAVVVGGGIVGASVAYHLARAGVDVLLADRADEGRATDAGAGILSPATSSRTASETWFEFAVEAVDYYPDLNARIREEGGGDTGYARPGLLSVAVDASEVEPFEAAKRRVEERAERLCTPAPDAFEEIPPERARELFPALARPVRALHFADAGRVDGRTFAAALVRAGETHGLAVERADVERIRVRDGAVAGVVADGEPYDANAVVVAGGAWSRAFGDDLGVEVPVAPQRGQIAHLDLGVTGADPAGWPMVGGFRGHYLVPWPDGQVAAGATREDDAGFAPHATAAGVREVLDEALRVAPDLAEARLAEVRVGLRPASADGLPVLGPVPGVTGVYLATGHGPTGLQLGPYSGKLVADLVLDRDPDTDLSPFSVSRFSDGGTSTSSRSG